MLSLSDKLRIKSKNFGLIMKLIIISSSELFLLHELYLCLKKLFRLLEVLFFYYVLLL